MTQELVTIKDVQFKIHSALKKAFLDPMKKLVLQEDWNAMIIISGPPGSGKSVMSHQIAYYLDPTYNLDRCVYDSEPLLKLAKNVKKGDCIVFDEAYGTLSSRKAMHKKNQETLQYFNEMRQQNGFLIVVIPDFLAIDKQVVKLANCWIDVKTNENNKRGFFDFYEKRRAIAYRRVTNEKDRRKIAPNFDGKFTASYANIDPDEYKKKKFSSLEKFINRSTKDKVDMVSPLLYYLQKVMKIPYGHLHQWLKENGVNFSVTAMEKRVSRWKQENEKPSFRMPD